MWRWLSGDKENLPAESPANEVRLAVRRDDTTTTYEAALPWSSLGLAGIGPGRTIGFALAVNDDDGQGRKAVLWFDGIVHGEDPARFDRLTMLGD